MVSFEKTKSAPPLQKFTPWCHTQITPSASWPLTAEVAVSPLYPWLQRQVWLFTFSVTRKHSGADLNIQNESCSHQEAENVYPITYHGLQKSLDLLYCLPLFEPNFRIWANAGLFYPVRAALGTFRAPPAYWSWQLKHNGLKLQVKNVISISRFPSYPKRRNLIKLTKNSVSSCNINHL